MTFAPMLDVARDPRWGRGAEGPGEDPWLAARFAEAKVRGFQGADFAQADSACGDRQALMRLWRGGGGARLRLGGHLRANTA